MGSLEEYEEYEGSLPSIVRSASGDERRDKIKPLFNDALASLVSEPLDESAEEQSLHDTALQILGTISEGDEGYNSLMQIFRALIWRKDPLADRTRELIMARYPQKRNEMRRSLFMMLADSDEVVRRVKNHIRELRGKTPSYMSDVHVQIR